MNFSNLLFIFIYLPAVIGLYYIAPRNLRNGLLLIANLIFYGWGEPVFILVMLASMTVNYAVGLLIENNRQNERLKKAFLILSVVISLGFLAVFKYAGFISDILRNIPLFAAMPKINIPLPIGISFYTFQLISYAVDVYRGNVPVQKNIINFGTYISFFPQLIAGPIVRYKDVASQLKERRESVEMFASGIRRFAFGLAKKVLIANQLGLFWEKIQSMSGNTGVVGAWAGIIAFTLQIYFDFSGYSDMAIGMGRMFGFNFPENFNYPYISKSITEFWRRWHISLSSWFRDYVYIPLGGNRCGAFRHIFNLFVVWVLTGLWHGASLNFIMWGLFYFVLLVLEKYVYGSMLNKLPGIFGHLYTMFFVMIGWVIFSFTDNTSLIVYLKSMFSGYIISHDALSLLISFAPVMFIGIVCSLPVWKNAYNRIRNYKICGFAEIAVVMIIILVSVVSLVSDLYNPFLYFRF